MQLLAQRHVHRDVRGGAASEERGKARLTQATKNERVGVRLSNNANHDGVGDKRDEEHAAHEHGQKQTILGENLDAVGGNRIIDQAENAERSEADDPAYDRCDSVGDVRENSLGGLGRCTQRNANQNAPCKNAQIIRIGERIDGVRDHVHEQRLKNFGNARRRRLLGSLNARKRELDGEQLRRDNRNQR